MGRTRIAREKRVGAEQDRRVGAVDEFGDDAIMQRRGVEKHRNPDTSGRTSPTVSPKAWNTGRVLNTLSVRPKSIRAAAWAALHNILRCDSTTPFGVPSEPEVNRIAAGSSALRGIRARR